jgi:integrase
VRSHPHPLKISTIERKIHGYPPPIEVITIEGSGLSLAPTPSAAPAAQRFGTFIKKVLDSLAAKTWNDAQLTVACSVAFEMLRPEDLLPFLSHLQEAKTLDGKVYVSWPSMDSTRRREISAFTLLAFSRCHSAVDWAAEISAFDQSISLAYEFGSMFRRWRNLATVFQDLQAWAYIHMPMVLAANHLNILPITQLRDAAWLRRYDLQLPNTSDLTSTGQNEFRKIEGEILEVVIESPSPLSGFWLVEDLAKICAGITGVGVSISDARAWRTLVLRLNRISRELRKAGPIEALMVGWAVHLVRFGSARKATPKVGTLARNLSAALVPIYTVIRSTKTHPLDLSTDRWCELLEQLIQSRTGDSVFRSAIVSFHSFLIRAIDAEPQYWLFSKLDSEHIPRANVIWPKEIDALPGILMREANDERLGQQVVTWALLLTSMPLRISELKWMRLSDFEVIDDQLELHVVSRRFAGSGKTAAASRTSYTRNARCISALLRWRERREKEGAELGELLFGDPHESEKIFRMGASYSLLNHCLKIVTGDEDFSSHLCRHTVISVALEQSILDSGNYQEINPIHRIQVQAGHRSAETTIRTYFHLPEHCWRYWFDDALKKIDVTYKSIEPWAEVSASTLAQRRHRARDPNWSPIDVVREAAVAHFPDTCLSQTARNFFPLRAASTRTLDLANCIRVSRDLNSGHDLGSATLRNSLSDLDGRNIAQAFDEVNTQLESNKVKIDFSRLDRSSWAFVCKVATSQSLDDLCRLTDYWLSAVRSGNIALSERSGTPQFLSVLKKCGVGVERMVVRVNGDPWTAPKNEFAVTEAHAAFDFAYGISPQFETSSPRRGRPTCYLQVLTKPTSPNRVVAASHNDTQTLNALMLSICVFLRLENKEKKHGCN